MIRFKFDRSEYDGRAALRRGRIISIILVFMVFICIVWQGNSLLTMPEPRTLVVYCFTGMQEVMENGLIPAFEEYWTDEHDEEVEIIPTFAGSGAVVDKIISRFPAEVAILSSPIDAIRLGEQMLVPVRSWEELPNKGVFSYSQMILIVREGNPFGITDLSDLGNPGVKLILPDPTTSGAGQWALLAFYSSGLGERGDTLSALMQVDGILENVTLKPANVRLAGRLFNEGNGDVLITYESNLLENRTQAQLPGELVYPQSTVVCDHIVLPIQNNIIASQRDLVDSFVRFLWSTESQQILAMYNFIGVDSSSHPQLAFDFFHKAYTLDSLGGPRAVKSSILDKLTKVVINPIPD